MNAATATTYPKAEITAPEGATTIAIVRDFATTPDRLWRCVTEPDLLEQWMGPDRLTCSIEEYDVRDGGRWRMVHTDTDGTTYGFHGVHHGDPTPELTVRTFEWDGAPGHVSLEWQWIEDLGEGRCRLHGHTTFMSVEDRDAMIANGMDVGVHEGNARLDALLAGL